MAANSEKAHDLSGIAYTGGRDHSKTRIAIVVSRWNAAVTEALLEGAVQTLHGAGVPGDRIHVHHVPGSFELPLGAQLLLEKGKYHAVICIGCVIQGETRHFDFISQSVADGVMKVGLKYNTPVIFGVLTPNNEEQALARAGGAHGNKGTEAAVTALEMVDLTRA